MKVMSLFWNDVNDWDDDGWHGRGSLRSPRQNIPPTPVGGENRLLTIFLRRRDWRV